MHFELYTTWTTKSSLVKAIARTSPIATDTV